eukprot:CAMPEP_0201514126 /NCGR_PEP_ID=MMETSP0161_2-20130828/6029_1 /ASSEMBLY_ACC=CAM_ASM_000251 /TAXON_ID=180227 /ORGANISM="Neoparamoeba aestuarina, Strain SoJaBio B1-5/56/2" /LENGTH=82 /DNA_ID=CAMNT_0047910585 /DNA_START=60 /DNA_END=308 /DNA_ORIENTATION=-
MNDEDFEQLLYHLEGKEEEELLFPEIRQQKEKERIEKGEFDVPDESDVDLVMCQTGSGKARARKALINCDGDIVEAIMEMTA